jgi:imidazolonepropionase-like amidohydrolase
LARVSIRASNEAVELLMRTFLLACSVFLLSCSDSDESSNDIAASLVFEHVSIVDVRAGLIVPNQVVVIANSHILEIGHSSDIAIPHGIKPIDATGKFLIPGLWEMHAHTSSDQVSRDVVLPLFIANGVTGIRSMQADCLKDSNRSCSSISAPIDATNRWRQDIAGRQLIGPRIIAGSPMVNGPAEGESSTVLDPATAEHGRAHARLLKARGVDFIKIYDELSRDAYFAIADEARKLGLPFAGHVPVAVRATEASDAGQASIEHCCAGSIYEQCSSRESELREKILAEVLKEVPNGNAILLDMIESFSEDKCAVVVDTLVQNETWFVPTLIVSSWRGDWRDDPRTRYLPPVELDYWVLDHEWDEQMYGTAEERKPTIEHNFRLVRMMKAAGVRILAGSDPGIAGVFFGSSLSEELELLVKAGFTEAEALRAATLSPAEFLGLEEDLGTIEVGKLADLVLLRGNPLEDIANTRDISAVVFDGRFFSRDDLDRILLNVERAALAANEESD